MVSVAPYPVRGRPLTSTAAGSTSFHPSSTSSSAATLSAALAAAKTASPVSASASSPLTILRVRAIVRSSPLLSKACLPTFPVQCPLAEGVPNSPRPGLI